MLKQTLTSLIALCVALSAQTQVSITLQVPPVGLMLKTQLWNMLLVNAGTAPAEVSIRLSLQDPSTNQVLMTATSRAVTLNVGATQLQATTLSPVQYEYLSPVFNADRSPDGFLPVGKYLACYTVRRATGHSATFAENCLEINVSPLSPPLLNTPADKSVVTTEYPQFTWIPPAPMNIFNDPGYDFILSEVHNGQSPAEAVQQNIPVYSTGNYPDLFYNYPSSNQALDTSKLYAWRIIARNNNTIVAQSDVWTFRVGKPGPAVNNSPGVYTRLEKGSGAALAVCTGTIKVQYNNAANDSSVVYKVSRLDNGGNAVVQTGKVRVVFGENLIDIPLDGSSSIAPAKMYLFQLFNSRNETWYMKFMYYKPK